MKSKGDLKNRVLLLNILLLLLVLPEGCWGVSSGSLSPSTPPTPFRLTDFVTISTETDDVNLIYAGDFLSSCFVLSHDIVNTTLTGLNLSLILPGSFPVVTFPSAFADPGKNCPYPQNYDPNFFYYSFSCNFVPSSSSSSYNSILQNNSLLQCSSPASFSMPRYESVGVLLSYRLPSSLTSMSIPVNLFLSFDYSKASPSLTPSSTKTSSPRTNTPSSSFSFNRPSPSQTSASASLGISSSIPNTSSSISESAEPSPSTSNIATSSASESSSNNVASSSSSPTISVSASSASSSSSFSSHPTMSSNFSSTPSLSSLPTRTHSISSIISSSIVSSSSSGPLQPSSKRYFSRITNDTTSLSNITNNNTNFNTNLNNILINNTIFFSTNFTIEVQNEAVIYYDISPFPPPSPASPVNIYIPTPASTFDFTSELLQMANPFTNLTSLIINPQYTDFTIQGLLINSGPSDFSVYSAPLYSSIVCQVSLFNQTPAGISFYYPNSTQKFPTATPSGTPSSSSFPSSSSSATISNFTTNSTNLNNNSISSALTIHLPPDFILYNNVNSRVGSCFYLNRSCIYSFIDKSADFISHLSVKTILLRNLAIANLPKTYTYSFNSTPIPVVIHPVSWSCYSLTDNDNDSLSFNLLYTAVPDIRMYVRLLPPPGKNFSVGGTVANGGSNSVLTGDQIAAVVVAGLFVAALVLCVLIGIILAVLHQVKRRRNRGGQKRKMKGEKRWTDNEDDGEEEELKEKEKQESEEDEKLKKRKKKKTKKKIDEESGVANDDEEDD